MVNKVILIGRLTKDLEKKYVVNKTTNQEIAKIDFHIAINKGKDKDADIIPCTSFDKLAENMHKYLEKGSQIYIDGILDYQRYTDDFGNKKTFAKVIVRSIQFLGDSEEVRARKAIEKLNNPNLQNNNVVINKQNTNEKQVNKKQQVDTVIFEEDENVPF